MTYSAAAPVRTACPYCGVGCGVFAKPDGKGGATIAGDAAHPANFGRLCSKGSALGETLGLETRLLHPMIGTEQASWNEALDHVAAEFNRVRDTHGPDSIAFYLSGQLLTEDYYVANKLAKGFIGTPHVDTNSRLCMASTVAGQRRAFGADVVPQSYEDLDTADLVILAGSNAAWCHPILYQRLQVARANAGRASSPSIPDARPPPRARICTWQSDPARIPAVDRTSRVARRDHGELDWRFAGEHTRAWGVRLRRPGITREHRFGGDRYRPQRHRHREILHVVE